MRASSKHPNPTLRRKLARIAAQSKLGDLCLDIAVQNMKHMVDKIDKMQSDYPNPVRLTQPPKPNE